MLWWILFVVSVIFIYVKVWKPMQYWKEKKVPYEQPLPILGSMLDAFLQRISFAEKMLKLCQDNKYRYFGFYQLWIPTLIVQDVELIKQITIKYFDSFTDHLSFASEKIDPLFANSLVLLKGQKWRNMRATLSPAFTSSKMKAMFTLISDCSEEFTNYFLENADPVKHTTVEMKDIFTRFANDVIATCAFGVKCNSLVEKENEFYQMGKRATDFSGAKGFRMFGYTVKPEWMEFFKIKLLDDDVNDFFRNLVLTTMQTREEKHIIRPDMIHLLMQARKGHLKYEESVKKKEEDVGFATVEESEIGQEERFKYMDLSDDDVTAQALIFFFAGFDSSSTLFCHMANELAVNPDVQQKLQAEVDETLKNCPEGKITYDAITKMKYLDMVVCETLRKWPPAAVMTRICTKPYKIPPTEPNETEVILEKDTIVFMPVYAIHHNPKYFPNPEKFNPERFSYENKDNIESMTFMPFGIGPRNCIGSRFAIMEAKILFVHLLSKLDIMVDAKTQIPLKLSKSNFNMTAENGFWLGFKPRTQKKIL